MRVHLKRAILWSTLAFIGFIFVSMYNFETVRTPAIWIQLQDGYTVIEADPDVIYDVIGRSNLSFIPVLQNSSKLINVDKSIEDDIAPVKFSTLFTNVTGYPSLDPRIRDQLRYTDTRKVRVMPDVAHDADDRIMSQLKLIPDRTMDRSNHSQERLKTIYVVGGHSSFSVKSGQQTFLDHQCSVSSCSITSDRSMANMADMVLFKTSNPGTVRTNPDQIWLLYALESPYHTPSYVQLKGLVNWTATYRHDSTIVAPYEKFVPFNPLVLTQPQNKSYAIGKTKKVAWFVSNCGPRNDRMGYAKELRKYIDVDIYGSCGDKICPRKDSRCYDMLNTDYKFYLAFENSNCRDYISEKYFVTGLGSDIVPIVMGGSPEDYKRASPYHSHIHVDEFESPKELAAYLHKLDQNDDLYNEYFQWKGTGTTINTYFWCRVCSMLNDDTLPPSWYEDVDEWWRGKGVCIGTNNWRQAHVT